MDAGNLETIPDRGELEAAYARKRPQLAHILGEMEKRLRCCLKAASLRPTITGRIKSFDSWYKKKTKLALEARAEGRSPIPITDIVAIRAVCPFLGDLGRAEQAISGAFDVVEHDHKGEGRSFREFGYESIHLLLRLPEDLADEAEALELPVLEVQLRTILQEAWAEVEHELVYKAEFSPFGEPLKRKLAALNANLSLSDIIFQEILDYQRKLNAELEKRRTDFYGKIDGSMDMTAAEEGSLGPQGSEPSRGLSAGSSEPESLLPREHGPGDSWSMDDLLLAALSAHNHGKYEEAAELYGRILESRPEARVASVVYKHRGMAFFARSLYDKAVADFDESLKADPACYKSAYYRGVTKSVLEDFGGAIADFDLALGIHPYHFFSRYRRGMAYWHLGDYSQALADSEAALRLNPESAQAARLKKLALERLAL